MKFSEINVSQIYFRLKTNSGCEIFSFPRSGVHTIAKKTDVEQVFFQFLMLNISSIKELLHKPLEIQ